MAATNNTSEQVPEKKGVEVNVRPRTSSSSSSSLSLKTPRTARFAEATSVNSPIGPTAAGRNPFTGPPIITTHHSPEPQVSDVGFGYMGDDVIKSTSIEIPLTPSSPLKSALKVPGTANRFLDPRSPTFREEQALDEEEEKTEKVQAKDIKVKTRVRVAKFFLRGVNFSCSLIVLAMLSTTFTIFNATKGLPLRGNLPAWAPNQQTWPQITVLVIACVSLAICVAIFWNYWRGGHRKAEKTAVYYTVFAIGFFVFTTVMWIVGGVILHQSRAKGNNQDMWGWACNDGKRATFFQDEVHYALVCRLQGWSLICIIIEVVVEVITIAIYGVVFYRVYSKRRLHKSMNNRDRARSDLYLAQLRIQSAPNTPGFSMRSPAPHTATFNHSDGMEKGAGGYFGGSRNSSDDEDMEEQQYARKHASFHLQPPPVKVTQATPILSQSGFEGRSQVPTVQEHAPVADGETVYESVPIPGAYTKSH